MAGQGEEPTREELAAVEDALMQNVDAGNMTLGVDSEGQATFQLTDQGKAMVESMGTDESKIEWLRRELDEVRDDRARLEDWSNSIAARMGDNFDGDEGQEFIIDRWLDLVEERMKAADPAWHRFLFESGPDPRSDD